MISTELVLPGQAFDAMRAVGLQLVDRHWHFSFRRFAHKKEARPESFSP
jgi:hypothetical protein